MKMLGSGKHETGSSIWEAPDSWGDRGGASEASGDVSTATDLECRRIYLLLATSESRLSWSNSLTTTLYCVQALVGGVQAVLPEAHSGSCLIAYLDPYSHRLYLSLPRIVYVVRSDLSYLSLPAQAFPWMTYDGAAGPSSHRRRPSHTDRSTEPFPKVRHARIDSLVVALVAPRPRSDFLHVGLEPLQP